eukprot:Em0006g1208a
MADGVKRARLDGDKEIYLAELLGVNIADAHTTVNEVPRSSGMPTWRIATNIPMTTWIVLNQESKLQLFNDSKCAESAVSYVDNAPQTMLALLNKIGVMTVSQWHAMPEERQSQLPSDVLFFLRNRVQERMGRERVQERMGRERVQERMERERVQERMEREREREWSKFLETVKTLAGTEQVEFRELTHHHFNYQGKETVILGEDRMKHIELVVSDIKAFQEAKQRFLEAKENHPIYCVVAAPRQGKSLLLDVLCSSIRYTGTLAVSITYNSATPYTEKDTSLLTCAPRFWARVVYTIANAFGANLGWLLFQDSSFISLLTLNRVLELVNMCLPQYSNKGIVVAADEFSEVLKGFVVEDLQLLMTASSHPLTMLWLNPAVQSTQEQYYPILEELKKTYPKAGLLGFLNPFLVIHELIRKNYPEAEMDVFQKLESAFTTVPWDADAKGDALEMLVVSALQLRQIHTQSSSFSFSKVLSALCGVLNHPSHLSSLTISTKGVKFRGALATGVESFPCHDSSSVNKGEAKPTGHSFCDDKEMKEARRIAAIGAIKSHGIIYPTSVMNKGCDIILVLSFEEKSKLIIFETKSFSSRTVLGKNTPSTKARMVLEGLLKNPNPLEGCNVSHVCFTVCVTNGANVTYDVASLDQCIKDLKDQGISVSLHSVSTKEQFFLPHCILLYQT